MQITYLIVADTLVATVITVLQLLQHIVSLKLGAFLVNCPIVTVSKPRYSVSPAMAGLRRVPFTLPDDSADQTGSYPAAFFWRQQGIFRRGGARTNLRQLLTLISVA